MDRTRVMDLADKAGGLFRLTVLLQKRVRELVGGAPPLIETDLINPIDIAMAEVAVDAIELVDLSDEELKTLEAETKMASEEAEILEALRSRVTGGAELKAATTKAKPAKVAEAKAVEPAAKAEEPAAEETPPAKAEEPAAKAEEPVAEETPAAKETPAPDEAPTVEDADTPAAETAGVAGDDDTVSDDAIKAE